MKTVHQKYYFEAFKQFNLCWCHNYMYLYVKSIYCSSFSMILAAIFDHVTDNVDCGLMSSVLCGFCFIFKNKYSKSWLNFASLSSCRDPINQARGPGTPHGKTLVRTPCRGGLVFKETVMLHLLGVEMTDFINIIINLVVILSILNWWIRVILSEKGLTLKMSALESLYSDQITLLTLVINQNIQKIVHVDIAVFKKVHVQCSHFPNTVHVSF